MSELSVFVICRFIGLHPYDGMNNFNAGPAAVSLAFLLFLSATLTGLPILIAFTYITRDNIRAYGVWTVLDTARCAACSMVVLSHWCMISVFRRADFKELLQQVRVADSRSFSNTYILWLLAISIGRLGVRAAMMHFFGFTVYNILNNSMEMLAHAVSAASVLVILQMCVVCRSVSGKLLSINGEQINFHRVSKFLRLVDRVKKLSKIYGPQMIFTFFLYFVESTNALYYAIQYPAYAKVYGNIQILFTSRNLLTLNFVVVISLTLFRHLYSVERTAEIYRKKLFLLVREHAVLCTNKKIRLYLRLWVKFDWSAFRFFSIGYPLMTTMVSATVTYLFVALQLSG